MLGSNDDPSFFRDSSNSFLEGFLGIENLNCFKAYIKLNLNDKSPVCLIGKLEIRSQEEYGFFQNIIVSAKGDIFIGLKNIRVKSLSEIFSKEFYVKGKGSKLSLLLENLDFLQSLDCLPKTGSKLIVHGGLSDGFKSKDNIFKAKYELVDLKEVKHLEDLYFLSQFEVKTLMISDLCLTSFKGISGIKGLSNLVLNRLPNPHIDDFPSRVSSILISEMLNLKEFSGIPLNIEYDKFVSDKNHPSCLSSFEEFIDVKKMQNRALKEEFPEGIIRM